MLQFCTFSFKGFFVSCVNSIAFTMCIWHIKPVVIRDRYNYEDLESVCCFQSPIDIPAKARSTRVKTGCIWLLLTFRSSDLNCQKSKLWVVLTHMMSAKSAKSLGCYRAKSRSSWTHMQAKINAFKFHDCIQMSLCLACNLVKCSRSNAFQHVTFLSRISQTQAGTVSNSSPSRSRNVVERSQQWALVCRTF